MTPGSVNVTLGTDVTLPCKIQNVVGQVMQKILGNITYGKNTFRSNLKYNKNLSLQSTIATNFFLRKIMLSLIKYLDQFFVIIELNIL